MVGDSRFEPTEPYFRADGVVPGRDSAVEVGGVTNAFEEWRRDLEADGELTADVVGRIVDVHGDRGQRAIEAVSEGRVKEYRDFTVVVGHREEYVVEGEGCTCKDAEYNLDPEDPTEHCWHVLAAVVADAVGEVEYHDMWYSEVREFL